MLCPLRIQTRVLSHHCSLSEQVRFILSCTFCNEFGNQLLSLKSTGLCRAVWYSGCLKNVRFDGCRYFLLPEWVFFRLSSSFCIEEWPYWSNWLSRLSEILFLVHPGFCRGWVHTRNLVFFSRNLYWNRISGLKSDKRLKQNFSYHILFYSCLFLRR